jgi:hypothetical protein
VVVICSSDGVIVGASVVVSAGALAAVELVDSDAAVSDVAEDTVSGCDESVEVLAAAVDVAADVEIDEVGESPDVVAVESTGDCSCDCAVPSDVLVDVDEEVVDPCAPWVATVSESEVACRTTRPTVTTRTAAAAAAIRTPSRGWRLTARYR